MEIVASRKLGEKIQDILAKATKIRVTNTAGTYIEAKLNSKLHEDAKYGPFLEIWPYNKPGSGGDYPSGEVGFGPEIGSVNGTIVFDYKIQHVGVLPEPLEIKIEKDEIKTVSGSPDLERKYREVLAKHDRLKFICEISIGLNPYIIPDHDSRFIPEEKELRTMHFGHGGNSSYGDRKGPHFDGVIKQPTLMVDDQILIKDGKFTKTILDNEAVKWFETFDAVF